VLNLSSNRGTPEFVRVAHHGEGNKLRTAIYLLGKVADNYGAVKLLQQALVIPLLSARNIGRGGYCWRVPSLISPASR
jgi:hypothetical protein